MFSERLKYLRLRKGMTQEEVAEKLELSRFAVQKYESAEREPNFATLAKIADFFDVSTDYLLSRVVVETPRVHDKLSYITEFIAKIEDDIDSPFFTVSKVIEQTFDSIIELSDEERREVVVIYASIFNNLNILCSDLIMFLDTKDGSILPGVVFDAYLRTKQEISSLIDRLFKMYIFTEDKPMK